MTMTKLEPLSMEWPERWRRWLDFGIDMDHWMRVEESSDASTMIIRAEIPGINPDKDVSLSVSDGMLHITAHREEHSEEKEKGHYHSEFRYGEFAREFLLPDGADVSMIRATYHDGILEVRVPTSGSLTSARVKVPITRT